MISTTVISYSEKQSTLEAHATWKIEFPWEAGGHTWIAEVSQNIDSYVYSSVSVLHPYHLLFHLCPPGTYACVTVTHLITEGWASALALPVAVVPSLSHVQLCGTPWTAAHQASLSVANSWSLLQLKSTEAVMTSHHLILWRPPSPPTFNLS